MNIQKYMAFVKTVEYGSFTRAAEILNYSQSGISRMINDLEKEWKVIHGQNEGKYRFLHLYTGLSTLSTVFGGKAYGKGEKLTERMFCLFLLKKRFRRTFLGGWKGSTKVLNRKQIP